MLEAAIREPMKVSPTRNVWIHESLEDEARRVWEKTRIGEAKHGGDEGINERQGSVWCLHEAD